MKEIDEVAAGSFRTLGPPLIKGTGYVVKSLEAASVGILQNEFLQGRVFARGKSWR